MKLLIRMHEVTVPQSQHTQADSFISSATKHSSFKPLHFIGGQKLCRGEKQIASVYLKLRLYVSKMIF